ncbi:MAG TPA: SBBP repeat-containing protein [Terriglobales bacterium]|nr:SBBP repeat-containing protein [Terriglobales bacterium]
MKRLNAICLIQLLTATFLLSQPNADPRINQSAKVIPPATRPQDDPKAQAMILDRYSKLPLNFEANHGQADGQVKFLSRNSAYSLFLTANEAVIALRKTNARAPKQTAEPATAAVLRMKMRHANPAARIIGMDELAGRTNYFIGNDPSKWRTNVPTYSRVKYQEIYSGIDLVYYGNQRQLEYDFIVSPGADPHLIALDIVGAKRIRQDAHGDLVFEMELGPATARTKDAKIKASDSEIRWHSPVVYQEKNGARQQIAAHYSITHTNRVAFELAKYDSSRPLYIDPLIYSTYLGGSSLDNGSSIAVDSSGSAYVTGTTYSPNFPTTSGASETTCQGCSSGEGDAFVTKFSPKGSTLVYSTYLGGKKDDYGISIAIDNEGNAYVTGETASTNFPTINPLQRVYGGGTYDAFVSKIDPSGSALVYSTYLGGSAEDLGQGIATDSAGNAYVTGQTNSTNFPTINPLQVNNAGGGDVFVAEINSAGSQLVYSTYLGGSNLDYGDAIAVDNTGSAYVTGTTYSTNFPTKNPFQPALAANWDAFVAKISPLGSDLAYSTYLGGSGSSGVGGSGYGIAVDDAGDAYVAGYSASANFPTTPGAFQTTYAGNWDAVVSKINSAGSKLIYSTYLGGTGEDNAWSIAVDSAGDAYVSGSTSSRNFPTENPFQRNLKGGGDAFVSKLNPAGSALLYSTYLGGTGAQDGFGVAVDSAGNAYVTGDTTATKFPTMNPVQPVMGGGEYDAFVAEIDVRLNTTTIITSSPNPSRYGQAVTLTATVSSNAGAPPDGETISFMKGKTLLGTGSLHGGSASFKTSTLEVGTRSIKALYGGDSNFLASKSQPVKQVVE